MATRHHTTGPLMGQTSIMILLDADTVRYLEHAEIEHGYTLERLAQIAIEEAALGHARTNNLTKE